MEPYQVPAAMTIIGTLLANGSNVARINCPHHRDPNHHITVCQKDGKNVQLLECQHLIDFGERGGNPKCELLRQGIINYGCPENNAPTMPK